MEFVARHPGWYYAGVVLVSLILPVVHPGLSLVSLALWIGMVPVHRRARKKYPADTMVMTRPVAAPVPSLPGPTSTPAPRQEVQAVPDLTGERLIVVGTGYYSGIHQLASGIAPAKVRREPSNSHDPNAIAVWAGSPLQKTGHLSAYWAKRYAPLMDAAGNTAISVPAALESDGDLFVYMPDLTESPAPEPVSQDGGWNAVVSWGRCSQPVKIEGAALELPALRRAVKAYADGDRDDSAYGVPGIAVRNGKRVSILIDGYEIGRLDKGTAAPYTEVLSYLAESRQGIEVKCNLWVASFDPSYSNATIYLPEPGEVEPPATLPTQPHVVLPAKSKIQVSGEDAYLNELTQILGGQSRVPVAVTLHETIPASGRGKPYIEVRIADDTVGKLTPTMSEHMLPIVRACTEEHLLVVCRATVEGNPLKADVVLDTTKAGDLSHEWILKHVQAPDDWEPESDLIPPAPRHAEDW